MALAHDLNAQFHRLPLCPECSVSAHTACVDDHGRKREPHRVRLALARNEVVVIRVADLKTVPAVRALRSLVRTVDEAARFEQVKLATGVTTAELKKPRARKVR